MIVNEATPSLIFLSIFFSETEAPVFPIDASLARKRKENARQKDEDEKKKDRGGARLNGSGSSCD